MPQPSKTPVATLAFDNQEFVAAVEERFEETVFNDAMSEALALMENLDDFFQLHPQFERTDNILYARCQRLHNRAAWLALSALTDTEAITLVKQSLSLVFTLADYNLTRKFRGIFMARPTMEARDQLKQQLRRAMLENGEAFRTVTVMPPSQLPQTIGGWLKHYSVYVNGKIGTSLQRAQYFTNVVGNNLSEEQKKQLKILIQAFDYLKLSSVNLESDTEVMSADVGGTPMVWRAGQLEEVIPPKDVIESLEKMGFWKPDPSENAVSPPLGTIAPPTIPSTKVVPESQKTVPISAVSSVTSQSPATKPLTTPPLSKIAATPPSLKTPIMPSPPPSAPRPLTAVVAQTGVPIAPSRLSDAEVTRQGEEWKKQNISGAKIFDLLFNAIQQKDKKIILAGLQMLAESGELLTVLKTDSRFYYLLANYYRHQKRLNDLKEFHMSFADPKYVKELTRYILNEQLKLSEDEAAHIGVDLVNMMRGKEPKLKHWAYFDMKTSAYKWL